MVVARGHENKWDAAGQQGVVAGTTLVYACANTSMTKQFDTHTAEVTTASVAAYAAATNDDNPRYVGDRCAAPPMFVVTLSVPFGLTQVVTDADVIGDPMRLLNLLHQEEEMVFHRLARVGDRLSVTPRLAAREAKPAGELLVVVTDITDAAGRPVAQTRSSLLIRERRPNKLEREISKSEAVRSDPVLRTTFVVGDDQSLRYAEAAGDRNPIHTDDAVARMVGLRGKVLHGLCSMAFVQRELIDRMLGGDPARLRRLRVRFVKPIYNGDTLTLETTEVLSTPATQDVGITVYNQDGQTVIAGGQAVLANPGA
mgnify:CR=1 FL=1